MGVGIWPGPKIAQKLLGFCRVQVTSLTRMILWSRDNAQGFEGKGSGISKTDSGRQHRVLPIRQQRITRL